MTETEPDRFAFPVCDDEPEAVYQSLIMNPGDDRAAAVLAGQILDTTARWRPLPDLTIVITDDVEAAVRRAEARDCAAYTAAHARTRSPPARRRCPRGHPERVDHHRARAPPRRPRPRRGSAMIGSAQPGRRHPDRSVRRPADVTGSAHIPATGLDGYLHRTLPPTDHRQIHAHLDGCEPCWQAWNRYRWDAARSSPPRHATRRIPRRGISPLLRLLTRRPRHSCTGAVAAPSR
ncbi:MAG: hypothetical protein GEU83_11175 [Pseudonocardiaceae bacterium]|nr:hypothetical protein [Pseudonocardiaceae bacterium]